MTQTATTVTGTPLPDSIDCSAASPGKTILGLAGNDTITGTAFMDTIEGGSGNRRGTTTCYRHVVARFPAMDPNRQKSPVLFGTSDPGARDTASFIVFGDENGNGSPSSL